MYVEKEVVDLQSIVGGRTNIAKHMHDRWTARNGRGCSTWGWQG
jgi:hypothetical protein